MTGGADGGSVCGDWGFCGEVREEGTTCNVV